MEPIKINVNVTLGVSDALGKLLGSFQLSRPAAEKPAEDPKPVEKKKPANPPTQEANTPSPAANEPTPEAPKPEQPHEPTPTPEHNPAVDYTAADVRAAMDRTRKRIEGDDYKENPDSEGHKTWHRELTAWFKKTAYTYGAEKPSALPDTEKREAFIKECDALYVANGKLEQDLPF